GCVNCHAMEEQPVESIRIQAKAIEQLNGDQGCLSASVPAGLPQYYLTRDQRRALQRAIDSLREPGEQNNQLHHQLVASNCYACHQRGEIGGPEVARDRLFLTTTQEMGNEGRVPPMINDVGDKLKERCKGSSLYADADAGFRRSDLGIADCLVCEAGSATRDRPRGRKKVVPGSR
ncbi:MAG: hypothetical protein MUD03_04635, partial [Pirellula sp.]|nr:hypothetical protein [Pirellula sp.]